MSGRSYTGAAQRRQPVLGMAGASTLAVLLAGCAGLPFSEAASQRATANMALTSLESSDSVDPSDWGMVKTALAQIPAGKPGTALDWQNPATGSDGTVTTLGEVGKSNGAYCRGFATTVNNMRGIRSYRGEACSKGDGNWQFSQIAMDDGASL